MAKGGWIKLHRKITEHWIWQDPEKLRAWLDLLLMVNREDRNITVNGQAFAIKRGQTLTSLPKLAERWHWDKKRVVRFLKKLEGDGMCHAKGYAFGTAITIDNWDLYQNDGYATWYATGYANGTQTRNREYKRREGHPRQYTEEELFAGLDDG